VDVTLGINTAFALKRWPRAQDWAPLVRDELGLETVQVCLDLVDLSNAGRVRAEGRDHRAALADHGLSAHSTFTGLNAYSANLFLHPDRRGRDAAQAWYRRAVEFTAEIGGLGTGGHVGAFSTGDWSDERKRVALSLELTTRLARLAEDSRTTGLAFVMVENLASVREPGTMAKLEELLTDGDRLRVPIRPCIDVGHQCVLGMGPEDRDPYAWLRRLGGRAAAIHLQQNDGVDRHWPFTAEFNIGGAIDGPRLLAALAASGASTATLFLEIIAPPREDDAKFVADLRESVRYWRDAIASRQ
jgi:sugar phosphate isomerase/epimerase